VTKHRPAWILAAAAAAPLGAQTFDDLTWFRNQEMPYTQVLQFKGGLAGAMASGSDPAAGLDDVSAFNGSAWYHDENFGTKQGTLDAYAGLDGLYGGIRDGRLLGGQTVSRLELKVRPFQFWREGFYRGNQFVPVGRYQGRDYEAYLGFGKEAAQQLFVEAGPYYRRNQFSRTGETPVNYIVPNDYNAYGARLFVEQRTVQTDRRSGLPVGGFDFVLIGEREWNDSNGAFGVNSGFTTELPDSVWRARSRFELYVPQSSDTTWEVFGSAQLLDEKDRVIEYEAQHPQGNFWVDATARLRILFSESLSISPFVQGQYTRILHEDGSGSDKKFFWGGGAEMWLHFSETVSMNAWYSYLDNESRPPVSIVNDVHGQSMFFAGFVLRIGATHR
jgi:hypothetical protein